MTSLFQSHKVVPVIVIDNADDAVPLAKALAAGGIPVAEVTLRTDAALTAIANIAREVPEVLLGAGTALSAEQVKASVDAGAKFIVSPGLHETVVEASSSAGVPIIPGVATATETQQAWNMGLRTLKFFPASQAGGPKMLKALGSVFRDVKFVPTGGVSPENLGDYLSVPSVLACGGSWLAPKEVVSSGNFERVTHLADQACAVANQYRS